MKAGKSQRNYKLSYQGLQDYLTVHSTNHINPYNLHYVTSSTLPITRHHSYYIKLWLGTPLWTHQSLHSRYYPLWGNHLNHPLNAVSQLISVKLAILLLHSLPPSCILSPFSLNLLCLHCAGMYPYQACWLVHDMACSLTILQHTQQQCYLLCRLVALRRHYQTRCKN